MSLISGQVREGETERGMGEREGAEFERMGGAALLRNAKHRINSIVKNYRDADRMWEWWRGGHKGGKESSVLAVGACCHPALL